MAFSVFLLHRHETHSDYFLKIQSWSPRGHGLGLEAPRGQTIVSLALALASDAKSLALAFGNLFPVLVLGFEPKSVSSLLKAMLLYQQS